MCNLLVLHVIVQILAKKKDLQWANFQRLGDVQKALNLSLPQAVELVQKLLHKEPYTRSEICQILEMKEEDFVNNVLSARTTHGMWFIIHVQVKMNESF